ncbi:TetR/AcrR family transcriptional regulator [Geomonas subterranea]|uniref:TetR/AcrR family transcriptional regulator n=1 Tax=Geomonas subterranea TaxID=2847989 RepID=UPI001C45567B|nr:TetR/AcrR family transcriptional regulator [Geomonas subterranea]QXM09128.1 TetR/AcrR family transcriptional regulator [Geomonas subterranea]
MGRTSDARERLLAATLDLIWEQSYSSVGVDAICERAVVKKGSFYHFFKSKAELAAEALQSHWEEYKSEMDAIFSPTVPPLKRLTTYFDKVYRHQLQTKEEKGCVCGCPYFEIGTEAANLDAAIAQKAGSVLQNYFRYFESAVLEAHAQGQICVSNPSAAARWLFNYFEGTLANSRIHNDPELLHDLSAGALQLLGAK